MTEEQQFKLAAKTALVMGPLLIVVSLRALTGVFSIEGEATVSVLSMGVLFAADRFICH